MQNLIHRAQNWFTIPRNRRQFIIGTIGAFVLVGVIAFSSQIGNLLNLFGSEAFVPQDVAWQSGPSIPTGGGDSQAITVTDTNGDQWLYSIGGLDIEDNRKNSVYRMKLNSDGSPSSWEGSTLVPTMNFGRAGHKLIEHNGFIYAIAGDIHVSETSASTHYPLAYSTIERLNVNNLSAGWGVVARITGVHFFPEVLVDDNQLHIVGGVYGNVPNMGGFEDVANPNIFDGKPVIGSGSNGIALTVYGIFADVLSESVVGNGTSGGSSYGKFYTTVSEHYTFDLNTHSYSNNELGSDGGEFTPTGDPGLKSWWIIGERTNGAEMKMGHLRFKFQNVSSQDGYPEHVAIPLPQGRYGHKFFKEDNNLFVAGGASWSTPMSLGFSPLSSTRVYPFWVIGDSKFPKQWTYEDQEYSLNWDNEFIGNTVYRLAGSTWVGTNSETPLDSKYSLQVSKSQGLDSLPIVSGISFLGLDNLGSQSDPTQIAVGGIANVKEELTYQVSTGTNGYVTVVFFMELEEIDSAFTFTNAVGWTPTANYSSKLFGIDIIGLGSKAVSFGGQSLSTVPYNRDGRNIVGWPQGYVNQTTTQVFNGVSWSPGGVHSSRIADSTVAYINNGTEAILYRLGGEKDYPNINTKLEYTAPLATYSMPDISNSSFCVLPGIPGADTPQLSDDGYAFTSAVFELKDSSGIPMSDIIVGVYADKDDVAVCTQPWWVGGTQCNETPSVPSSSPLIYTTTDNDGRAVLSIKSKDEMKDDEYNNTYPHIQSEINVEGWFIVPGFGSFDNPTGTLAPATLELTGRDIPFNKNSDICFIEGGNCIESRNLQVLADGTSTTVEVGLWDGRPQAIGGPQEVNAFDYDIKLTASPSRDEDLIVGAGYSGDNIRYEVSSSLPGEIKLRAWYKPKFTHTWLEPYLQWIPIWVAVQDTWGNFTSTGEKNLTIQFIGQPGTLTPNSATQGDEVDSLTATGEATQWSQDNTTVEFINPPEITFNRSNGFDDLDRSHLYNDFSVDVGSEYGNELISLSIVYGGGILEQSSVTADANGNATFQYTTSSVGGIEKIRATVANGQVGKELWMTVKHPIYLYTIGIKVDPDPMTDDSQYSIVRARLTSNSTGQPVTGTQPIFSFSNNDNGILHQPSYNSATGIAQVLYEAGADGRNAEILVEVQYLSNIIVKRIPIDNTIITSSTGITFGNLIVNNDELQLSSIDISDSAEVGFWIFRATTSLANGDEAYDYLFEVKPKIVEGEGFINSINPAVGNRGTNLSVTIDGTNTWFNAIPSEDVIVKFIPVETGQEPNIEVVSLSVANDFSLVANVNIASNTSVGYWNVEVVIGSYVYEMPGDFDFLVAPDDPSGYFINLAVGTYGVGWEPGSLPSNGTATLDLTASVGKFDVWENLKTSATATIDSSITSGTGELTPDTKTTVGGQAVFTYLADTVQGIVETLFETTIDEVDFEVTATLNKLANQITFNLVVPLEASRYNYLDNEEIRVVILKDGSLTPVVDDKYKIDADDKIIGLPNIYVSPSVEYHIWVDPPNHLAVGATFIAPTTSQTISPILESAEGESLSYIGDINTGERNNYINTFDYQEFVSQMFKGLLDPTGDFNDDGNVNIFDWSFLSNNYWSSGYPKPF